MSTYEAAHAAVARVRGRAAEYRCVDCGQCAVHWSYDGAAIDEVTDERGRRFSRLTEHYAPRCGSCHTRYDHAPQWLRRRAARANAALTTEQRSAAGKARAAQLHHPTTLARRIAKAWPELSDEDRRAVRRELRAAGVIA